MTERVETDQAADYPIRCDHCHYPIPEEPAEGRYCSTACREAADEGTTIPDPEAYKRVVTGVGPIDSLVPDGVPTDAFILLSGNAGTRRTELTTELVWRALERGEPAVVVSYTNPPTATLERFYDNGWNVLPALESDRLRIVDCFTHRLENRDEFLESRNEWRAYLGEAASDAIVEVTDPTDVREVASRVTGTLDDLEMTETGLVAVDSLDELETVLQEGEIHDFITTIRATVCTARYVPIVAAGTTTTADEGLDPDSKSLFDGVVELRLTGRGGGETQHRRLAVRKLVGTQFSARWLAYEYEPGRGLLAVTPEREPRPVGERERRFDDPGGTRPDRR